MDHYPTKEQAKTSMLFSPIRIGTRMAKQRTWVPAMVPWRATLDGYVTDAVLDWYRRFALGRPGVLVVEATGISDIASGALLRIGSDQYIEGLSKLVSVVKEASEGETLLFIQLIDFLPIKRRPSIDKFFGKYLSITDIHRQWFRNYYGYRTQDDTSIRDALMSQDDACWQVVLSRRDYESLCYGYRECITDVHLSRIQTLPQRLPFDFARAACRAKQAGFDGVELHYAHAYTMASFLSRRNTRTDNYGGSLENRVRLPNEVLVAVRKQVGSDFLVGVRMLTQEIIEGGSDCSEAIFYAEMFAQRQVDYISLSRGGKFEDAKQPNIGQVRYPYTGDSGHECIPAVSHTQSPFGLNVEDAGKVRCALVDRGYHHIPVVVSGGIASFVQAESVLQNGSADIIASARQSLADPDWFRKLSMGLGREIRRCIFTNYCEGLDQKHKQVTCQLWDRLDLDEAVSLDITRKRRLTAPQWNPSCDDQNTQSHS